MEYHLISVAFFQSTISSTTSSTTSPFLLFLMLSMFLIRWRDTLTKIMTTPLLIIFVHLFITSLNSNLIPNLINLGFLSTASAILDSTLHMDDNQTFTFVAPDPGPGPYLCPIFSWACPVTRTSISPFLQVARDSNRLARLSGLILFPSRLRDSRAWFSSRASISVDTPKSLIWIVTSIY